MINKLYPYILFTIILPVFSTNTMDQNTTSNSNTSQHSNTVTPNQQVSDLANNQSNTQKNRGVIGGLLRYATKKLAAQATIHSLVGIGSEQERAESFQIYKKYRTNLQNPTESLDPVLRQQIETRRSFAARLAEDFIDMFKTEKYNEQDIVDASELLKLEDLDYLLPSSVSKTLTEHVDRVAQKRTLIFAGIRKAIKSPEQKNVQMPMLQQPEASDSIPQSPVSSSEQLTNAPQVLQTIQRITDLDLNAENNLPQKLEQQIAAQPEISPAQENSPTQPEQVSTPVQQQQSANTKKRKK